MSSAVVSTSAAQGRPFVFDEEAEAVGLCGDSRPRLSGRAQLDWRSPASKILPSAVTPASGLEIRPAPELVSSGIPAIDALTGGLPRGCLTEICGPASSGRTTFLLAALAAATRRGEFCTLIDASDALDPHSAASAGVALDRLLWMRCGESSTPKENSPLRNTGIRKTGAPFLARSLREKACPELAEGWGFSPGPVERVGIPSQTAFKFAPTESQKSERRLEQVLRATDLLLESGGFGLIVLDLADLPPQFARRIPLTTWFRFRRAIEHTPTILLAIEQHPIAGSCSSLLLQLGSPSSPEEAMRWAQSNSSRVAAAFVSPGRKPWVAEKEWNESRRACPEQAKRAEGDGTAFDDGNMTNNNDEPSLDTPTHVHLLTGLNINAELIRSRLDPKPAHSVRFETKTAWAG